MSVTSCEVMRTVTVHFHCMLFFSPTSWLIKNEALNCLCCELIPSADLHFYSLKTAKLSFLFKAS